MRSRRVLLGLLAVLGALEIAYVGAGLSLVRSGRVERWINKHPEKLRVTFDSAWSVVHFRGLRIVQQRRGSQLEGVVDSGWGTIDLLELPARRDGEGGLRQGPRKLRRALGRHRGAGSGARAARPPARALVREPLARARR